LDSARERECNLSYRLIEKGRSKSKWYRINIQVGLRTITDTSKRAELTNTSHASKHRSAAAGSYSLVAEIDSVAARLQSQLSVPDSLSFATLFLFPARRSALVVR